MVTRKQYTKECKSDAINLVLDQKHTTTEVSRSLEINAACYNQLSLQQFFSARDEAINILCLSMLSIPAPPEISCYIKP